VDAFAKCDRDVQFLSCVKADAGRWQPMLLDGRFEGVVVLDALSAEMASGLDASGLPAVLLNAAPNGRHPAVVPDDREGGRNAARLLVRHGHRHVVFAGDEHRLDEHFSFADRLDGANDVLLASGSPTATAVQLTAEATVAAVLAMRPVPTAVIAYHGMIGVWLLQAFWRQGLRVPRDLSILTFDDLDSCRASIPPLTVLDVPMRDMAGKAAELLLGRIESSAESRTGAQEIVVFGERLVERESVGPAPAQAKG
jgi:LacI family transcriptional regulator